VSLALGALVARQRALWAGLAAGTALFLFLYGGLWLPRSTPKAAGPVLTVMTYSVLGFNDCPKCVVATIRQSGADLVTLQELSPALADGPALVAQLCEDDAQAIGLGDYEDSPAYRLGW